MSRLIYATLLALTLACAAAAQTRRGTQTAAPARPKPATTPAQTTPKPAQTPAPAPRPQQQQQAAPPEDCGCEAGPVPEVLGAVNSVKITRADLSPQVQQRVTQLQQEVVEARKRELDLQINSILLEAEAKKRNISTQKLIEAEVLNKSVEPTAAEAEAYFNQNKSAIEAQAGRSVAFAEVKDNVIEYMRQQRQQDRAGQYAQSLRATAQVKKNVEFATPPSSAADRARVFATVNGRNITSGDVEDGLLPLIASVQEEVYLLRKNDVDQKINDILLSQEAQKRGVTDRALLESEVASKVPVITEAQAQDFFNKNKERIGSADFGQIKYQIIDYLQDQERQRLSAAFASQLRNGASVQTFITPPAPPVFQIATDDQPAKGKEGAAVTVVEFTDYQCPSCAAAQPVLEKLITEYGDRVRFVVRDFPLQMHEDARKAAEAAEAARAQDKYWDFTAILFRNQSALKPAQLKEYARVIGLDRAKFDAALDGGTYSDKVDRDLIDGQKFGVSGTPTFFVNGRRAKDASYDSLKAAIDDALKAK